MASPVIISRSCRWHRKHWPEMYAKPWEHVLPLNCVANCIGYQWSNVSTTSSQFWLTSYKVRQSGSPSYLASLSDYAPDRSLRSSDKLLLSRPYTSLIMVDKAFSVIAPKIWNDLSFNCSAATCVSDSGFLLGLIGALQSDFVFVFVTSAMPVIYSNHCPIMQSKGRCCQQPWPPTADQPPWPARSAAIGYWAGYRYAGVPFANYGRPM